jgi:small subunit ribosomal protein S2
MNEKEEGDKEIVRGNSEAEIDADAEISRHMDEVRDGEDHRQKGGRSIKFSD